MVSRAGAQHAKDGERSRQENPPPFISVTFLTQAPIYRRFLGQRRDTKSIGGLDPTQNFGFAGSLMRRFCFLIGVACLSTVIALSAGGQHVGTEAKEKRDEALAKRSGPVHAYTPSDDPYDHMPAIVLHNGGAMDLVGLTVVGSNNGEDDPFLTEALWVEDEQGEVVYFHEGATKGGFALADYLRRPGCVLTAYNLDSSGLWIGPPFEVPQEKLKDEL